MRSIVVQTVPQRNDFGLNLPPSHPLYIIHLNHICFGNLVNLLWHNSNNNWHAENALEKVENEFLSKMVFGNRMWGHMTAAELLLTHWLNLTNSPLCHLTSSVSGKMKLVEMHVTCRKPRLCPPPPPSSAPTLHSQPLQHLQQPTLMWPQRLWCNPAQPTLSSAAVTVFCESFAEYSLEVLAGKKP